MTNAKCKSKNCKCINKKVAAIILVIGLFIGGGVVFLMNNRNVENVENAVLEQAISAEEAEEKVLNVINQHMLPPGITASLVSAVSERGLHKITVDIEGQEAYIYLTKDGALLFPGATAVDLNALIVALEEQKKQRQEKQLQPEFTLLDNYEVNLTGFTQGELRRLAKRLTNEGVLFFAKGWCPFCVQQKEMFGEAAKYLPHIECCPEHGATEQELALCRENNVGTVPDWRFPNKEPILGRLSIERLIELSSCELLKDRL